MAADLRMMISMQVVKAPAAKKPAEKPSACHAPCPGLGPWASRANARNGSGINSALTARLADATANHLWPRPAPGHVRYEQRSGGAGRP